MQRMMRRSCLFVVTAVLLSGCSLIDDDDCRDSVRLVVTISASGDVTSSSDPVVLTVRAENRSPNRIVFGYGSSSCQLHSFVRTSKTDYFIPDSRICTDDMSELSLDPGESRTEIWSWEGQVRKDRNIKVLPPGVYRVCGAAGTYVSGNSVRIEVLGP